MTQNDNYDHEWIRVTIKKHGQNDNYDHEWIRATIKKHGLWLNDVAAACGTSPTVVSAIQRGYYPGGNRRMTPVVKRVIDYLVGVDRGTIDLPSVDDRIQRIQATAKQKHIDTEMEKKYPWFRSIETMLREAKFRCQTAMEFVDAVREKLEAEIRGDRQ